MSPCTNIPYYITGHVIRHISGADPGFFAGGVNNGRVLRAPLAPAPTGGLGLINIRLRYIEYSERFFLIFFFAS